MTQCHWRSHPACGVVLILVITEMVMTLSTSAHTTIPRERLNPCYNGNGHDSIELDDTKVAAQKS